MKRGAFLTFVAGAIGLTALITHAGAGVVGQALATFGWGGLGILALLHIPVIILLGFGWWFIGRDGSAPPWKFVWARLVRDAAADVLPFSQVGGFVIGARALTLMGLRVLPVGVSMLVDLVIEFSAKLPYMVVGLLLILDLKSGSALLRPAFRGLALTTASLALLMVFRARIKEILVRGAMALGGRWPDLGLDTSAERQPAISRVFAQDGRMFLSFVSHSISEVLGAVETWVMFRLIGVPITGLEALLIDSLSSGLRTFGFLVPAALGVQEAVYVLACSAVGISPAIAIAFSLARRARDLAIGIPALGVWQWAESQRLLAGWSAENDARNTGEAQQ